MFMRKPPKRLETRTHTIPASVAMAVDAQSVWIKLINAVDVAENNNAKPKKNVKHNGELHKLARIGASYLQSSHRIIGEVHRQASRGAAYESKRLATDCFYCFR